jgi:hypothetical protein
MISMIGSTCHRRERLARSGSLKGVVCVVSVIKLPANSLQSLQRRVAAAAACSALHSALR